MTVTECLGCLFSFWLNFSRIVLVGVLTNIIYEYHGSVETEYWEMLFRVETEHSDKELYRIIAQSRPVQMISY